MNSNFTELYNVQDRAIEEATEAVIKDSKLIWQEPVDTSSALTTTYPNAVTGYTVMARDTGKIYRFNEGSWNEIQDIDPTAINEVDTRLTTQLLEENAYYHPISYGKYRDDVSATDYYITTIQNTDDDGNLIKINRGFADDLPNGGGLETARHFANRKHTTVGINASVFDVDTNTLAGTDIHNGQVLNENLTRNYYTLGIKDDNTFVAYPPGTTAQTMISEGCINALSAFIPLVENGLSVDQTVLDLYAGGIERHPRQVIAQMANKDILILTCEGRTRENAGMTSDDLIRILLMQGVEFAYMLDGGSSAQTTVRGTMINNPFYPINEYEESDERGVVDFLYFSKTTKTNRDIDIATTNKDVGEINKKAQVLDYKIENIVDFYKGYLRLMAPEGFKFQGIEVWEGDIKKTKLQLEEDRIGYYDYVNSKMAWDVSETGGISTEKGTLGMYNNFSEVVTDANSITENGKYWITSGGANTPDPTLSWDLDHRQLNSQSAIQEVTSFTNPVQKKARRKISGVWEAWG